MNKPIWTLMAIGLLTLSACKGKEAPEGNATSAVASPTVPNDTGNVATPAANGADTLLSQYVGKHPSEALSGRTFLEQPLVKSAVERTVPDAQLRDFIFHGDGPDAPIVRKNGRLLAWGCERHNCGYHNWAISIAPDGTAPEICLYHDDRSADGSSRWFLAGGRTETRAGNCPSE